MKRIHFLFALSLIWLTGCASTPVVKNRQPSPETVMVTYHVKPAMDVVLKDVLAHAWEIYRKEHLVFAEPHIIVQDQDASGQTRIVEIFTWVSRAGPEHAPDSVKQLWAQMQSLCLGHDGHGGLEGGEVGLVLPKNK